MDGPKTPQVHWVKNTTGPYSFSVSSPSLFSTSTVGSFHSSVTQAGILAVILHSCLFVDTCPLPRLLIKSVIRIWQFCLFNSFVLSSPPISWKNPLGKVVIQGQDPGSEEVYDFGGKDKLLWKVILLLRIFSGPAEGAYIHLGPTDTWLGSQLLLANGMWTLVTCANCDQFQAILSRSCKHVIPPLPFSSAMTPLCPK